MTSLVVAADSGNEKAVQQVDIFQGGTECYHTYRIPAIVLSSKNTLLAFCEGRKTSDNDAGDVDLMLRRSSDGGKTWRPMQLVYEKGGSAEVTIGNPCPVVDRTTGTIWLPFCRNNDRVFITKSKDDDLTWSKPVHHEQVYCPTCQASIQRYSRPPGGKNRILYSGPGGPGRNNMTIRLSYDEGNTWPVAKVLYAGSAAYSDLVVLPDGSIGCLYERDDYRKITFTRFTLGWLTEGKDQP